MKTTEAKEWWRELDYNTQEYLKKKYDVVILDYGDDTSVKMITMIKALEDSQRITK